MKYDFTSTMDRHGKDAIAVDGLGAIPGFTPEPPEKGFDVIPMWVADMNFPTVPTITEAIIERAKHPAFGYFMPEDRYFNSIIKWQEKRHHVTGLTKECIGYENGIWRMDFEDMDAKIKANKIHVVVFCNPHNPCGRVWEKWEIEKAMEIYKANDCVVISDEIWSGIILKGHKHIPVQSVSEDAKNRTAAFYAPSKTFNLAGLIGSYHIIYNTYLRDRIRAQSSKSHYNDMNVLSMHALIGAYKPEGYEWVDELCSVLSENVDYVCDYIAAHFDGVHVSKPEGTYMLFLDCSGWCEKHGKTIDELEKSGWKVGVAWQDGRMFHGPCAIRLNVALPLSRVKEAMSRLDKYVFNT